MGMVGEGGSGEACDPVLMEQQAAWHGQGAGQSAGVGADERGNTKRKSSSWMSRILCWKLTGCHMGACACARVCVCV